MPETPNTADKLLDAAERLFSRHGIEATSLRTITAEAEANLAAVHYHFGSKEGLVREVFRRRLAPLNEDRLARLDRVESRAGGGRLPLDGVVRAFLGPAIEMWRRSPDEGRHFARLMGRVVAETGTMAKVVLEGELRKVIARFLAALARAAPELPREELIWRFHFMVGAMAHSLANPGIALQLLGDRPGEAGEPVDARLEDRIVAFLLAGFRAEPIADEAGNGRTRPDDVDPPAARRADRRTTTPRKATP